MKLSIKIAIIIFLGVVASILVSSFILQPVISDQSKFLQLIVVLVLAGVPIAAIIWALIYFLTVDPVVHMVKISKTVSTGNLGKRIQINSNDEIGQIAKNFNQVIDNLASGLQNMSNALRSEKEKEQELANNYETLNREKAKDEALLTSIGEAIVGVDGSRRITVFNKTAGEMLGIDPQETLNEQYPFILKFLNEKDNSPAPDFINMGLHGEKPINEGRIVLQKKDGSVLPILQTTTPILDTKQTITGVVVVLTDITRERELEKLKDEFVSLASHELRTPMTAIKGLISMIFEGDYGDVNQDLKEPLQDVASSTDRLIQLVNDILDVSRIEAGRTKFELSEVVVEDLAKEISETLKPLTTKKSIELKVAGTLPHKVSADSDKVKQILINLVNNALKFTDHGSITITLRSNDKFAYISVVDTGIGISQEDQDKLFAKFAQISSSQMGRPPGTGLGLYISKEFSKKMGGDLWIEHSELGKGTTFTFTLPLVGTDIATQVAKKLAPPPGLSN